ncbi:RmlC-like cupin domain-containing protein [Xylariaceae sp. AK1471]|nr:RmlC-like cupin domain-containing protein [Xylariaceae sp. AK1471]
MAAVSKRSAKDVVAALKPTPYPEKGHFIETFRDDDGRPLRNAVLGNDIWNGERLQVTIRKDEWKHTLSLGDWTLVGCTVAPPFTMESFEIVESGWEPNAHTKIEQATQEENRSRG